MYEYLKHMEYPPERGYDRKILESNCKIGRENLKIVVFIVKTEDTAEKRSPKTYAGLLLWRSAVLAMVGCMWY
jgi:hypothetical protein